MIVSSYIILFFFFFQAEDGIRDLTVTGVQRVLFRSFAEGLPVVIMEALALGRPVLATAVAGIPELVSPECGWLVPAGSVEALVQAMKDALATPPEIGRASCRERVWIAVGAASVEQEM